VTGICPKIYIVCSDPPGATECKQRVARLSEENNTGMHEEQNKCYQSSQLRESPKTNYTTKKTDVTLQSYNVTTSFKKGSKRSVRNSGTEC
jgi:hypothetical protein